MIRSVFVLTGMTEQRDKLMMQKNKQMITGTESLSGQRESTVAVCALDGRGAECGVRRQTGSQSSVGKHRLIPTKIASISSVR